MGGQERRIKNICASLDWRRHQGKPYLGDLGTVHDLIARETSASIGRLSLFCGDAMSTEEMQAQDEEGARALARVFLGQDEEFAAVPDWNCPGHVDEAVATTFKLTDVDPETRLISVIQCMQLDAKLAAYMAAKGAPDDAWRTLVHTTVNTLAMALVPTRR